MKINDTIEIENANEIVNNHERIQSHMSELENRLKFLNSKFIENNTRSIEECKNFDRLSKEQCTILLQSNY